MWRVLAVTLMCWNTAVAQTGAVFPVPQIPFSPQVYVCSKTSTPVHIDGLLDDPAWRLAPWTSDFVDIEGVVRPVPRYRTRAKMLWDDENFYVAAELQEPNVWARLTQRDTIIYHDNDFEVFIDPDGDTHLYYELELNARNTVWDLLLVRPYRDGGPPVIGWDIHGLRTAVHVDGTLNDPGDRDRGWTVEIAFPWDALKECARTRVPPQPGDRWRVNFSRVEWKTHTEKGRIVKDRDPNSGRLLREDNWVWSPQGLINMHYPEMWGIVQFELEPAGSIGTVVSLTPAERVQWVLREVYYAQKRFASQHGHFADSLDLLKLPEEVASESIDLRTTETGFEATLRSPEAGGAWHIREDGRVWLQNSVPGR